MSESTEIISDFREQNFFREVPDVKFKFIEQYVSQALDFSSQYGSDISISYTACNIVGKPSKFPNYGDFPQTFLLRTYGTWWNEAPSRQFEYMPQNCGNIVSDDYIDLLFESAVYPWQIYIYETYNPGAIVRVWCTIENNKWKLLWESPPKIVPPNSRAFCPAIKTLNHATNVIRLEFNQRLLNYHTEIDAVMLVGSMTPIPSLHTNRPSSSICRKLEDLDIKGIQTGNLSKLDHGEIQSLLKSTKEQILEQQKIPFNGYFVLLPDEIILRILKYLDLLSLARCTLIDKRFYNLAKDPLLYTSISLKPYWYCANSVTLTSFAQRCQLLQKLDLSWCGDHERITQYDFCKFLKLCGKTLTHLRLNCCKFVTNMCLKDIGNYCQKLKELCLRNCVSATETGFERLAELHQLERLDLYRAGIEGPALVSILRNNPKLKHLSVGACGHIASMNDVAFVLSKNNLDLISVDFWKSYSLSPLGVQSLITCTKLQELDLGWCLAVGIPGDCLAQLARNCFELRRLVLTALRGLTDSDLVELFTVWKKLEQIDLVGLQGITSASCISALVNCPNLRLLDISFCGQITDEEVELWRREYPKICIKRSFQADMRDELAPVLQ